MLPTCAVLTGTTLGAGFDAAGQLIDGNEYRPGQTVIVGVTGGMTYPAPQPPKCLSKAEKKQ